MEDYDLASNTYNMDEKMILSRISDAKEAEQHSKHA